MAARITDQAKHIAIRPSRDGNASICRYVTRKRMRMIHESFYSSGEILGKYQVSLNLLLTSIAIGAATTMKEMISAI